MSCPTCQPTSKQQPRRFTASFKWQHFVKQLKSFKQASPLACYKTSKGRLGAADALYTAAPKLTSTARTRMHQPQMTVSAWQFGLAGTLPNPTEKRKRNKNLAKTTSQPDAIL